MGKAQDDPLIATASFAARGARAIGPAKDFSLPLMDVTRLVLRPRIVLLDKRNSFRDRRMINTNQNSISGFWIWPRTDPHCQCPERFRRLVCAAGVYQTEGYSRPRKCSA